MLETIVYHLRENFDPDAIILHGSRARRMEREHSDWDFILIYKENKPAPGTGRLLLNEQNIEFQSENISDKDVISVFGTKLQQAKVVFEKDSEGTDILFKANEKYEGGINLPLEKLQGHKLWMKGRIDGMSDCLHEPILFDKYFSDVYPRIFSYWYWFKQSKYSQPIYVAVREIEETDTEYYKLIEDLSKSDSRADKLTIIKKLDASLFQE